MVWIFVNLKRFEVPRSRGGICPQEDPGAWIEGVIGETARLGLGGRPDLELVYLLPEGLILRARQTRGSLPGQEVRALEIGCQGVHWQDVAPGGNFGAFTGLLPAAAARALGCSWALIGHGEERRAKLELLEAFEPGLNDRLDLRERATEAVSRMVGREVGCALAAGLKVLLCVGETAGERGPGGLEEQKPRIESVLRAQLERGLEPVAGMAGRPQVAIGYEPVWAIGPGRTPPGAEYIAFVSAFIQDCARQITGFTPPVVYGGGLKEENASLLAGIESIDGGLVALTRFTPPVGFAPEGLQRIVERYREARKGKPS